MKFDSVQPWTQAAEAEPSAERESAARAPSFISDVLVPATQSVITGALLAALVVFLLSELVPGWGVDLSKVWMMTALAITAVAWLLLLVDTRRLLRTVEKLIDRDLDGDGTIGQPRDRLVFVDRQKAKEEAAQSHERSEWLMFVSFIRQLPARGTTITFWESELGRARYVEFRDALIDYGLAAWKSTKADGTPNTTQGWELIGTVDETLESLRVDD